MPLVDSETIDVPLLFSFMRMPFPHFFIKENGVTNATNTTLYAYIPGYTASTVRCNKLEPN